jgi:hypothetical protein
MTQPGTTLAKCTGGHGYVSDFVLYYKITQPIVNVNVTLYTVPLRNRDCQFTDDFGWVGRKVEGNKK